MGDKRKAFTILYEKPERGGHLWNLDIGGRIILKWIRYYVVN
jgi:hypothetical protein